MEDLVEEAQINQPIAGVISELGTLLPKTLIFEEALAAMFDRHVASIKRAVDRGELPPPVRMFGKSAWTVEAITAHITSRLGEAAEVQERLERKVRQLQY